MLVNKIYNEDCLKTMSRFNHKIDVILTSPPYNTSRVDTYSRNSDEYNKRYPEFDDSKSDDDYIDWTLSVFEGFNKVLKKNGCILYNLSYSSEKTYLMWLVVADIIRRTNFVVADTIIWKKTTAIPNNRSSNKLTRVTEYIFVFCRNNEVKSFHMNKKVLSVIEKFNQNNYESVLNFIEAKNNDGPCSLNKATFSSDLCRKLLKMYAREKSLVYDPFIGTGTTAIACIQEGLDYLGSELSLSQCEFAEKRILNYRERVVEHED